MVAVDHFFIHHGGVYLLLAYFTHCHYVVCPFLVSASRGLGYRGVETGAFT